MSPHSELDIITCVEVYNPDARESVWVPLQEYKANPTSGTYTTHSSRYPTPLYRAAHITVCWQIVPSGSDTSSGSFE